MKNGFTFQTFTMVCELSASFIWQSFAIFGVCISFLLIDLFKATKQLYQDLSGQHQLVDNSMLPVYDIFR